MLRCRSRQPPHTPCRRRGHRRALQFSRPGETPEALLEGHHRPASWAYHPVYWAEANHWSGRGGMTCTPMTKHSNGQAITDRPGDPNIWYISAGYPYPKAIKPSHVAYIPTTRMIPLDQVSPVVGMAGIDAGPRVSRRPPGCPRPAGHDGLQRFRPAESPPQGPACCDPASRGVLAGLVLAGHGFPVCPRSLRATRYIQLSLTVPPAGLIRQILVQPSSWTARIEPMCPAIQAIPTFGIFHKCYQPPAGYKPINAKYSARLDGMGGPDR